MEWSVIVDEDQSTGVSVNVSPIGQLASIGFKLPIEMFQYACGDVRKSIELSDLRFPNVAGCTSSSAVVDFPPTPGSGATDPLPNVASLVK